MPLTESALTQAREAIASLPRRVRLLLFAQSGSDGCAEQRAILQSLAELAPQLSVSECDVALEPDRATRYGVTHAPAITVLAVTEDGSEHDYGVRFIGVTAGYEFSSLVEAIRRVSAGDSGLSGASRTLLAGLKDPVTIRVLVTPTCAYCPGSVSLAHRMAIESPVVTSWAIEVLEFPDLIRQYRVNGVPKTVVNEARELLGTHPEASFVRDCLDGLTPEVRSARSHD